jgi:hypothetical protein
MVNCGIRKRDSVRIAIQYLLTVGIAETKQPILTRKQGVGGSTSHYKLHLGAMQALIRHQKIFDVETGKRIHYPEFERPDGVPVKGTPTQEGVPVKGDTGVPVTGTGCPLEGDGGVPVNGYRGVPVIGPVTLNRTLIEPPQNPKNNPLSKTAPAMEEDDFSVSSNREPGPTATRPDGNGLVLTNSGGGLKSSKRFTLKRWCSECNEPSKITDGDECPHCGENIALNGDWLTAPRSDAEGTRMMEAILNGDKPTHQEVFEYAKPNQRRWIAMGKHAPEFQKWLDETGDTK